LIAIADPGGVDEVSRACEEIGYPHAVVGEVTGGTGVYVDGVEVERIERTALDELYGTFKPGE
jgi:thiamine monophosphate kinase